MDSLEILLDAYAGYIDHTDRWYAARQAILERFAEARADTERLDWLDATHWIKRPVKSLTTESYRETVDRARGEET